MRLKISHTTTYDFDAPVTYGLQQLRKRPKSLRGQEVVNWRTTVEGGANELTFEDHHRNTVELISMTPGIQSLTILNEGEVDMTNVQGIVGKHVGPAPLWLFERTTPLTRPGKLVRDLVKSIDAAEPLPRLHSLSAAIGQAVTYKQGSSTTEWSAEKVLEEAVGVCQDHSHVFLSAARHMGFPARYVSGYLMMDDRVTQDAMHAWAEAHVPGLGWVGFDVSNGISPDARYVRVSTGLDYTDAAPVIGRHTGGAGERLTVRVDVAQQQ